MFIFSFLTSLCFAASLTTHGTLFELGSHQQNALFTYERIDTQNTPGTYDQIQTKYKDTKGNEAVTESVQFENGKLKKYTLDQKQKNETGEVEIKDGRVYFKYKSEKIKADDEKLVDNFVIGPLLVPYLQTKWKELLNGETIDVRYAVLDRQETVGFKFLKTDEPAPEGVTEPVVTIKMKPTSIFIAALVKPLLMTFKADGSRLLVLRGRAVPKIKKEDQWTDLDSETRYRFP